MCLPYFINCIAIYGKVCLLPNGQPHRAAPTEYIILFFIIHLIYSVGATLCGRPKRSRYIKTSSASNLSIQHALLQIRRFACRGTRPTRNSTLHTPNSTLKKSMHRYIAIHRPVCSIKIPSLLVCLPQRRQSA